MATDQNDDPIVAYASPRDEWVCLDCAEQWDAASGGALTPVPLSETPSYFREHGIEGMAIPDGCSECGDTAYAAYLRRVQGE